jgi:hypothetical protein
MTWEGLCSTTTPSAHEARGDINRGISCGTPHRREQDVEMEDWSEETNLQAASSLASRPQTNPLASR